MLLEPEAAQPGLRGESESAQERLQEARLARVLPQAPEPEWLGGQPCSQAPPQEPQALEVRRPVLLARQPVSLVLTQQQQAFQPQMQARLQEPQVSEAQPPVLLGQPPDACAPLSPPLPSLLFPFWLWLLPPLPRPLRPECVCAPSPRHPQG